MFVRPATRHGMRLRRIESVLLLGALAASPVAASPPDVPGPKEVTITVVSDPDQLTEKVNRISLPPPVEEPANESQSHGKGPAHGKEAENAHENAARDADSARHDGDDKSQGDTNAKPDTPEALQQDADHSEAQGGD